MQCNIDQEGQWKQPCINSPESMKLLMCNFLPFHKDRVLWTERNIETGPVLMYLMTTGFGIVGSDAQHN